MLSFAIRGTKLNSLNKSFFKFFLPIQYTGRKKDYVHKIININHSVLQINFLVFPVNPNKFSSNLGIKLGVFTDGNKSASHSALIQNLLRNVHGLIGIDRRSAL